MLVPAVSHVWRLYWYEGMHQISRDHLTLATVEEWLEYISEWWMNHAYCWWLIRCWSMLWKWLCGTEHLCFESACADYNYSYKMIAVVYNQMYTRSLYGCIQADVDCHIDVTTFSFLPDQCLCDSQQCLHTYVYNIKTWCYCHCVEVIYYNLLDMQAVDIWQFSVWHFKYMGYNTYTWYLLTDNINYRKHVTDNLLAVRHQHFDKASLHELAWWQVDWEVFYWSCCWLWHPPCSRGQNVCVWRRWAPSRAPPFW